MRLKLSKEDINKIKELYEQGLSLKKIGKHFGITPLPIKARLLEAGVTLRKGGISLRNILPEDKVLELHNKGIGIDKISKKFKVNHERVRQLLNRNGIEVKRRGYRGHYDK